jgi:TonB family protein
MKDSDPKEIRGRIVNPYWFPSVDFLSTRTLTIKDRIFSQARHESRACVESTTLEPCFYGHVFGAVFTLLTLLICSPLFASHAYDQQLKRRVDAVWYKPDGSEGLSTTVRFGLDRAGNLTELRIIKSSGNRAFDKSLVEAFRRAAPFSPLPQAIAESYSGVELTFGSAKAAQTDETANSLEAPPPPKKQPVAKPSPKSGPKKEPPPKSSGAPI